MRVEVDADASFDRAGAPRAELDAIWSELSTKPRTSERFAIVPYFIVVVAAWVSKPFWTKLGEKAGEKLGDEIGADIAKLYRALSDTARWGFEWVGDAALRVVFHIRDRDEEGRPLLDLTCTSADPREMSAAHEHIPDAVAVGFVVERTLVEAGFRVASIHLVWDSGWAFSYAMTVENNAITSEQLRILGGA